jgi:hypothetical protein
MKTKLSIFACATAAALGLSGCNSDNGNDQSPASVDATASTASAATETSAMSLPADTTPAGGGMSFDQMDRNHDGSVTPDEVPDDDPLKQHFNDADINHDGKLSPQEFNAYRANGNTSSASSASSPAS